MTGVFASNLLPCQGTRPEQPRGGWSWEEAGPGPGGPNHNRATEMVRMNSEPTSRGQSRTVERWVVERGTLNNKLLWKDAAIPGKKHFG